MAHAFISPSNTLAAKCFASPLRQELISRRAEFLREYASHYLGAGDTAEVMRLTDDAHALAILGNQLHDALDVSLSTVVPIAGLLPDGLDEFMAERMAGIQEAMAPRMKAAQISGAESRFNNVGVASGGTMDIWFLAGDTLSVFDLKTGYVEVVAEENIQLMRYACAVLDHLAGWDSDISTVELGILGVRFKDSTWNISVADLKEWRDGEFKNFMVQANRLNPVATAGSHCANCSAKAHCNEVKEWAADVVQGFDIDFKEAETSSLEDMFLNLKVIGNLRDDIRDELLLRSSFGMTKLSRLKIKEGAKRTYFDPAVEDIESHIALAIKPHTILMQPEKLKTATQIKKLVAGNKVAEAVLDKVDLKTISPNELVTMMGKALADPSAIVAPEKLKTAIALGAIFNGNDAALKILADDTVQADWFELLSPLVSLDVMFEPKQLKTASKVAKLLPPEVAEKLVKVGRNSPSLAENK